MTNYKELIERLKIDEEWAEGNEWDAPIGLRNDLHNAAVAIATLESRFSAAEAERNVVTKRMIQLEQELAQVKAERDAFENAEKQGRLAVLPCKVGDMVYSTLDDLGHSYKCEVTGVYLSRREHESYVELDPISYRGSKYGASFGAFGKTVFLTREEAEAALTRERKDGEG